MKKFLIALLVTVTLFTSCKKTDSSNDIFQKEVFIISAQNLIYNQQWNQQYMMLFMDKDSNIITINKDELNFIINSFKPLKVNALLNTDSSTIKGLIVFKPVSNYYTFSHFLIVDKFYSLQYIVDNKDKL